MSNHNKAPNPWIFAGLSVASFATFWFILKRRETTYPASSQPRHADHPLVSPIRKPDSDA
ncbi:hypothetical protein BDZ89DRAFT_952578 [Hymenopellis radicata]|nr:hypothetical protein BDZ89DRAFT_952578 [Hymenopellis radicata]